MQPTGVTCIQYLRIRLYNDTRYWKYVYLNNIVSCVFMLLHVKIMLFFWKGATTGSYHLRIYINPGGDDNSNVLTHETFPVKSKDQYVQHQ